MKNEKLIEVADWTELIPLPTVSRPYRSSVGTPSDVRTADDLPSRWFLGDLDEASFRRDGDKWSAVYRDEVVGTQLDVDFDGAAGRLSFEQLLRGRAHGR